MESGTKSYQSYVFPVVRDCAILNFRNHWMNEWNSNQQFRAGISTIGNFLHSSKKEKKRTLVFLFLQTTRKPTKRTIIIAISQQLRKWRPNSIALAMLKITHSKIFAEVTIYLLWGPPLSLSVCVFSSFSLSSTDQPTDTSSFAPFRFVWLSIENFNVKQA